MLKQLVLTSKFEKSYFNSNKMLFMTVKYPYKNLNFTLAGLFRFLNRNIRI